MSSFNSPFPPGFAYRLDAINVQFIFDAAGAILMNNKSILYDLYLANNDTSDTADAIYIQRDYVCVVVQTGQLTYSVSLAGSRNQITAATNPNSTQHIDWDRAVERKIAWLNGVEAPSTPRLEWRFFVKDGTVFPANTQVVITQKGRQSSNEFVPDL